MDEKSFFTDDLAIKNCSGWWLSHTSEKYESQLGLLFPIYGKSFKIPWFQTTNQT